MSRVAAVVLPRRSATGMEGELPGLGSWRFTAVVVAGALLGALYVAGTGRFTQLVVALGCAYFVAALGYNIIAGYAGQLAFGQAGFLAISAYLYAVLREDGVGTLPAAGIGLAGSIVAAAIVGVAVLRTRHFYLALVTLAFAEAVVLGIQQWEPTHGDDGISVELVGENMVYVAIAAAALSMIVVDRVVRSRLGRALAMVSSDERVAEAMGVATAWTRVNASIMAGALGGVGGLLLAGSLEYIAPQNFEVKLTVLLLTIIVVGGLGSIWGTVVGTALIVYIDQVMEVSTGSRDIVYGVLLFLALALLPRGLVSLPAVAAAAWARLRPQRSAP
jgi:branched-chain amino acid transport system permease protein